MPAVVRFYPYEFSSELEIRASNPYDPTQENVGFEWLLRPDETDEAFLTLNLAAGETAWNELRFDIEVVLSRSELDRVLPAPSAPEADSKLLVSVRCPATKMRESLVLAPVSPGRWKGQIILNRLLVRNVVELWPILVRKTTVPASSGTGYATTKDAIIADGRALRVVVDISPPPIHGTIHVNWEDFRHSKHSWRKQHAADVFFLDPTGELPTLWLNSRYASLRAALHSPVGTGVEAAVRHLCNAGLAQAVWLQLFGIAAFTVKAEENEFEELTRPTGWHGSVLDSVLPRLFPTMNSTEQLEELATHMQSTEQLGSLMAKAGSAIQDVVGTYRLVERAIRAAEKSDNRERGPS